MLHWITLLIALGHLDVTNGCNRPDWKVRMHNLWNKVATESTSYRPNIIYKPLKPKTNRIKNVITSIDRECFMDPGPGYREQAYLDVPVKIPNAKRAAICSPHMHLYELNYLAKYIQQGSCVLDVGSGSGYLTAVMSRLVGSDGIVIGVDYQASLINFSKLNIKHWNEANGDKYNTDNIHLFAENIYDFDLRYHAFNNKVRCKDGFNAIQVGAAANYDILKKLVKMMAKPSRLIAPIQFATDVQYLCIIDRNEDGSLSMRKLFRVNFVPLIRPKLRDNLSIEKILSMYVKSSDTIKDIKQKIKAREGIPLIYQQVTLNGKVLDDDKTLNDYVIGEESTLDVVMRLDDKSKKYVGPQETNVFV